MTPKRRFLAGVLGGRVDRVPIGSVTSVVNVEQMRITGAYFPDVHLDGKQMARLAAGAHDILDFDALMPYFSVQAESAALGCDVDWGSIDSMPVTYNHPWSDPEQVDIPEDFLEKPSIKAILDAIQILRYQYGHYVAIVGKVMGPWTLSYHLHGLQDFLIKTITNTKMVRCFLDKLKEVSVLFGIAQIRAGADILCIADHATGDLVGPWTYRDFLLEYHKELSLKLGCPTVLHICGDTLDRLDYICDSGFDAFHFDSKVDAKSAVGKAAGRISLMGNINNTEILLNGSEDQVVEQTRYALEAGVQVVGPECAIPLHTPLNNLKAIRRTVAEEG